MLNRKVSEYEFACISEWAVQNNWASEPTALLFMVSSKQLAPWYKQRLSSGQSLLGAKPANPPKWASLTGEYENALDKKNIPTLDDLSAYKDTLCNDIQGDSADIIASSYKDANQEQPQNQESCINKAQSELKTVRLSRKMRRKAQFTKKRQEKVLANQKKAFRSMDATNKQEESMASIKGKPVNRGVSAD